MMLDNKAVHTQTVLTPNDKKGAYKKRIAHIAYSVIGGGILLLAGIPPIPAQATPAPGCVRLSQRFVGNQTIATATNTCGRTVRFRFIWAWANDGLCRDVRYSFTESRTDKPFVPTPYVTELRQC
jgi:hypothetical protein